MAEVDQMTLVAQQFTQYYYQLFDSDRSQLAGLYRAHSMLTYEEAKLVGHEAIVEKLTSLPFQKVEHVISKIDAQPSSLSEASLLVLVIGFLKVDDGEYPLNFSQTFQLIPEGGSYYVLNDIFRLNLG